MINVIYSIENLINNRILGLPRNILVQTFYRWHKALIIVGVLLFSAFAAYVLPTLALVLLIGIVPGIIGASIVVRYPLFGIIAAVGSIMLLYDGPSGFNLTSAIIAMLLGLWVLEKMIIKKEITLVPSMLVRPLIFFVAIAVLSFIVGQMNWYTFAQPAPLGAQVGSVAIFVISAGTLLMVGEQIQDLRWLKWITWTFLGVVGLYLVGQIIPMLRRPMFMFFTIQNTGSVFWVWAAALAFSQAMFNGKLHMVWRVALGGLVLALFYVGFILAGDWKSGWLPAAATVGAIIAFRYWRLSLLMAPLATFPALFLANYLIASDEYSYGTRIDAWLLVADITKVNPILGVGPANYRWYTPLFPIRGYSVFYVSHSQYVDLYAQTGILGIIAFFWVFAAAGWLAWTLRERAPEGFARAYVYGALGAVVGMLVSAALGDWVVPFFYNVGFTGFRASILGWIFLGGLVAIEQMVRKSETAPLETPAPSGTTT